MSEVKKIPELPDHLRPVRTEEERRVVGRQVIVRPYRDGAFGIPVAETVVPSEPGEAEEI